MSASTIKDSKCNRYYKKGRYPKDIAPYYTLVFGERTDNLIFKSGDYNLNTCDKLTGVYLKPFATEIKPWAKKVIEYYEDQSN